MRTLPGQKRWLLLLSIMTFGLSWWWTSLQAWMPETSTSVGAEVSTRIVREKLPIDPTTASSTVPILMYHYIRTCDDPEDENCPALSVSRGTLTKQLQWMQDQGYVTVDLDYLEYPYATTGKPFVITLDDGYADTYTDGLPVFEQFGYSATWYLITERIGTPGYVTWTQVRDLERRGMTIGSHTQQHHDLTGQSFVAAQREISDSKRVLETILDHPVNDFCYPFGRQNAQIVQLVRQAGYHTATTTTEGIAQRDHNLLVLPRMRIQEQNDLTLALSASFYHE